MREKARDIVHKTENTPYLCKQGSTRDSRELLGNISASRNVPSDLHHT